MQTHLKQWNRVVLSQNGQGTSLAAILGVLPQEETVLPADRSMATEAGKAGMGKLEEGVDLLAMACPGSYAFHQKAPFPFLSSDMH